MLNQETTITIGFILACIAAVGTLFNINHGQKSEKNDDISKAIENASEFTRLNVKLDVMSQQFTELIRTNEKTIEKISQLNNELTEVYSRIKLLFDYKDALEKRIERLEGGKHEITGRNKQSEEHSSKL